MKKLSIDELYRYNAGSDCTDISVGIVGFAGVLGAAFPPSALLFAGLGLFAGGVSNWICDQPSSTPGSTYSPGPHRSGPR